MYTISFTHIITHFGGNIYSLFVNLFTIYLFLVIDIYVLVWYNNASKKEHIEFIMRLGSLFNTASESIQ